MSNDAYQNALTKKARLLKELEEVNSFLRLYARFAPKTVPEIKGVPSDAAGTPLVLPTGEKRPGAWVQPHKVQSVPERFAPIIERLLNRHGAPVPRREMLSMLAADGNPIPGKDPSKNLGTIMWRLQDRFVNLPGHGFWIKGRSYLPAGYSGEHMVDIDQILE